MSARAAVRVPGTVRGRKVSPAVARFTRHRLAILGSVAVVVLLLWCWLEQRARAKYRALVRHCGMKEDLYTLVSLMLGELNASHLGITGPTGTPDQQTADLGLVFDPFRRTLQPMRALLV